MKNSTAMITVLMALQQILYSGMNILWKLAANDGIDQRVLVAYRFIIGSAFMIPIALFFERNKRPKLTWKVVFYAFLCGLFGGAVGQNLFLASLSLTSATYASAMINLMPAFTILVALCFRVERLGWYSPSGKAKVFGTLVGIGGAMLFTFYKGPNITVWKTNINLLNLTSSHHHPKTQGDNPLLGLVLAFLSCIFLSLWFVIQAKAAKHYPCPLSFTALMVLMASIASFVAAACMQHDWSQWRLGLNIRLLTVAYSGTMGTTVNLLITLGIASRGSVFVAAFNPLSLIIVAVAGSLVLQENMHLGRLFGGILIICGLYIVLWGKSKEKSNGLESKDHVMPIQGEDVEDEESPNVEKKEHIMDLD